MARTLGIGKQDFEKVRKENAFYIDKTKFIRQWWESEDDVTLITRPRRFGKTLNMSMLERFFSVRFAGQGDLFRGLAIWEDEKYRRLQGTYPVLFISFADVKETTYIQTKKKICRIIKALYNKYDFLLQNDLLNEDEYGLYEKRQEVKTWYDGFPFGKQKDIYNPWSILNYLDKRQIGTYWANSSSNSLAGKLIREGSRNIKESFEVLLQGKSIVVEIDEQIVCDQLDEDESAIWSLLLASGYLKVKNINTYTTEFGEWKQEYELELINFEVEAMFRQMIRKWFSRSAGGYNDFIKALLLDDVKGMNVFMNKVAMTTFSYFDTGKNPSEEAPERFYHGFVLGLLVELADRYVLTFNRESGFGCYDVMLEPRRSGDVGIIMEFRVQDRTEEKELSDTVDAALKQIKKEYETVLIEKGIFKEKIRSYGFAFCGKKVLINKG